MVDVEDLISQISLKLKVSREEILKKLEDKKQKTGGLISNGVLLRMMAAELGVEIAADKIEEPSLLIRNL
ncbi:MAG: hypothetical protein QXP16_06675, partial [Candidatus Bathyarchaeia archaeon]